MIKLRDATLPKLTAGSPVAPIFRGRLTALLFAADPNAANKDGRTALFMAVDMHDADYSPRPSRKEMDKLTSEDIIHSLVGHKANVNAQLKSASDAREAVKMCFDRGLDVKAVTDKGETAMHGAALRDGNSIVKFLAEKGADINAKNKQGFTPRAQAGHHGSDPGVGRRERSHRSGRSERAKISSIGYRAKPIGSGKQALSAHPEHTNEGVLQWNEKRQPNFRKSY